MNSCQPIFRGLEVARMRWEILLRALGLVARKGSSGLVYGTAVGLLLVAGSGSAGAQDVLPVTAALPPASQTFGPEAAIPQPLDAVDAARYRQIFRLQDKGDWHAADEVIGELTDLRLLGHVLAQRYLHPKYRSRYVELAAWLSKYRDHPDAPAIYRLAMVRMPAGVP